MTYFKNTYPSAPHIGYINYYDDDRVIAGFSDHFPRGETHLTNDIIDFTSNGVCEETRDVQIYADVSGSEYELFNCPSGTDATDCGC